MLGLLDLESHPQSQLSRIVSSFLPTASFTPGYKNEQPAVERGGEQPGAVNTVAEYEQSMEGAAQTHQWPNQF